MTKRLSSGWEWHGKFYPLYSSINLIALRSLLKVDNVDEYRIARIKAVSIIFLKICRGWSDLNGKIDGSDIALW